MKCVKCGMSEYLTGTMKYPMCKYCMKEMYDGNMVKYWKDVASHLEDPVLRWMDKHKVISILTLCIVLPPMFLAHILIVAYDWITEKLWKK